MNAKIQDTSAQDIFLDTQADRGKWLLYLLVGCVAVLNGERVLDRETLRLAVVKRGDLVLDVVAQGRVVAANSPTLYATETGTIDLLIKAGDTVEPGQVVARILSPALAELLSQEQANLLRLQAELEGTRIQGQRRMLELQQRESLAQVNLKAMVRERRRADAAHQQHLISGLDHEEAVDYFTRAALEFDQSQQNNALENHSLGFEGRALQLAVDSQSLLVEALQRRFNVRELENACKRASLIANDACIDFEDFGIDLKETTREQRHIVFEPSKQMIEFALQDNCGVITQAARQLGMSRQALYRRLEKYGIAHE